MPKEMACITEERLYNLLLKFVLNAHREESHTLSSL
jgi:hypothetical protein